MEGTVFLADKAVWVTVSSGPGGENTVQVRAVVGGAMGGMLRDHKVSEGLFVPVRYGVGDDGDEKVTAVGVKMAEPSGPKRAETDIREWERSESGRT